MKRSAIAAARAEAKKRGYSVDPRIAALKGRDALLRELRAMAASHELDGNRRTAHCLRVAANVISELQAELDRTGAA